MNTCAFCFRQGLLFLIVFICIVGGQYTALAVEPIATIGQPQPEKHVFLSNDRYLRVVRTHIRIVDSNSGVVVAEFADLIQDRLLGISPTGAHVAILRATGVEDNWMINIWDVNTQNLISEWEIEAESLDIAAFSPVEPILVISADNQKHLWNWQTGAFLGTMVGERRKLEFCYYTENGRTCGGGFENEMVFTLDGKYFMYSSRRSDIEMWNVETRKLEGHFEGHEGNWVVGLAMSPDGKKLASFEVSNLIYVWDIETRQLLWKRVNGIGRVTDLTFSPDSQHLYVSSRNGRLRKVGSNPFEEWDDKVRVWDVSTGEHIDTFSTEFRDIEAITLSPDGKTMLLNYHDAEVIWDIKKKQTQNVWGILSNPGIMLLL